MGAGGFVRDAWRVGTWWYLPAADAIATHRILLGRPGRGRGDGNRGPVRGAD